jgi:hypothetical protein
MPDTLSYYAKAVMSVFRERYGDTVHTGAGLNIMVLKDLVPRAMRDDVMRELLEKTEYLEMIPVFPGMLILTSMGLAYLSRTARSAGR